MSRFSSLSDLKRREVSIICRILIFMSNSSSFCGVCRIQDEEKSKQNEYFAGGLDQRGYENMHLFLFYLILGSILNLTNFVTIWAVAGRV